MTVRAFALAGLVALAALGPPAVAENPLAPPKGGVFPEVKDASDDEAKAALAAVDKALKGSESEPAEKAVAALATLRHEDFVDRLKGLLGHKDERIAAAAAMALGSQGDKGAGAVLSRLVTEKWSRDEKKQGFRSRMLVRAAAVESMGRLGMSGAYDAVMEMAKGSVGGEAERSYALPALRATVRYFGLTKEKRAVTFLIDLVDLPEPKNVNDGNNPPAEYWKARVEVWRVVLPEISWALKEITGEEFENGRRWRNWYEDTGKKAGFK